MEFIDVNKQLPTEHNKPHLNMLWLATSKYGEMSGFFHKGKFMKNYSCEILDVMAWLPLPKYKKNNIKESLKADFIKHLTGCSILFYDDLIDYIKDGKLLFSYRKNDNHFGMRYTIWREFKSKYSLNYQELKYLVEGIVEEVLNYKGVTTYEPNHFKN